MKYAYIASQRTQYPIGFMCRVFEVSSSGFFAWQARQNLPRSEAQAPLREAIIQIHQQSRRRYGRRRLTHALRARGWRVNPKRVRRVMREQGLRGVRKGRFVPRTTDSAHQRAIAPNVLHRRFGVATAVASWTSDITYIATREGWLYLAVIIALQTRQVLGYSLCERMPDELVLNALRNACHLEMPLPGTLFHSDRGSQYASNDFREALGSLEMVASMSRKGNCWDNAVSESFFATLKTEEATGPYATKGEAHRAIAAYIHGFYNPLRLHSSLGYVSPNEYARRIKHAVQSPPMRSAA